jgi:hypothetical protein
MKRRKYISYFLLMVSFVMLVAAVFPHHHHLARICWQEDKELFACEDASCTCCDHAEGTCNHHSDSNPCEQDCVTKFSFSVLSAQTVCHVPSFSLFTWAYAPIHLLLFEPVEVPDESLTTFYLERLHAVSLYSTGGFRAPPCA